MATTSGVETMDEQRDTATRRRTTNRRLRDRPSPARRALYVVAVADLADDPHRAVVTERLVILEPLAPVA